MKKKVLLLSIVLLSLFLFACSENETESVSTSGSSGPVSGGVLSMPITGEPTTLNAWEIRNTIDTFVGKFFYETLMAYDETGNPQPYLLESLTGDSDAKTYTMKVREGITFQDGSQVNGESVAWNLNFYKKNGVLTSSFYSSFISAEATGDYEVIVHMSEFDSLFPYTLARTCFLISQKAYEELGEKEIAEHPVGTGAFKVSNWEHGIGLTLEAYNNYWQGKPYISEVKLPVYSEILVAQASLMSGELNGMLANADYDIADEMNGTGFSVYTSTVPQAGYTVCYNALEGPFMDVRVRQAASYAIDSIAIRDALCENYAEVSNQWTLKGGAEYNDDIVGYEHNLEKAKALLQEAGYPDGFETTINCQADNAYVDVCQIVVEQLAKAGINATLNAVETANYVNYIGKWDGMLMHPMGTYNGQFSQISANYRQGIGFGLGVNAFLHPDDVNKLIVKGQTKNLAEAHSDFLEATRLIFDDYCMQKGVYLTRSAWIFDDSVKGIGTIPSGLNSDILHKVWIEE